MHYLIGIDDTDNLESRGTGYHVRQLGEWLSANQLALPKAITRHQLLVDPQIPYTSHNSSACMSVETDNSEDLWEASREYLLRESALGSDAGLCLAPWESVDDGVMVFGRSAKVQVLKMPQAEETAARAGIRLAGLTGTGGGIIGALAGVGLHRDGNDGRYLWLPGLRELKGRYPVSQICQLTHVDRVSTLEGINLASEAVVDLGEWVRPVLKNGYATLFVEPKNDEWSIVPKERIKNLSN